MDHASLLKQFEHLDPHNQNTFEAKDLELLISTVGVIMTLIRLKGATITGQNNSSLIVPETQNFDFYFSLNPAFDEINLKTTASVCFLF